MTLDVAKHTPPDSLKVKVADWMIIVQNTGLCCAEYAQKTQSGVDEEHIYPSGKRVIKAFLPTDWEGSLRQYWCYYRHLPIE